MLEVYQNKGLSALLFEMTDAMDNLSNWWEVSQTFFINMSTNLTNQYKVYGERLDAFKSRGDEQDPLSWYSQGPLHWFMGISAPWLAVHPKRDASIRPGRRTADANGQPYPDGKSCYTRDCLFAEIDYLNDEPFSSMEYVCPVLARRIQSHPDSAAMLECSAPSLDVVHSRACSRVQVSCQHSI